MRKIYFILVFFILSTTIAEAQRSSQWRRFRHSLVFQAGTSNFLGELGGANTVGAHSIRDFDFKSSRYAFSAGYNYRLAERWTIGGVFTYARIYGNDKFTLEKHRNSRNLHFRSPLLELSPLVYFDIITESYSYSYRTGGRGRAAVRPRLYIFTGISGLWFNPKAMYDGDIEEYKGKWFALQPMGTEGQGNPNIPTREKYKRVTMAIPMGFGLDYPIDNRMSVGFEFGYRYSFTDYMDDVSKTYVDPALFGDDLLAKYFADPTEGEWNGAAKGQQRGQSKYNDTYMFLTLTLKYKIVGKRIYIPKF